MKRACVVLNAFRHQRFDTSSWTNWIFVQSSCSTPFGIRDSTQESTGRGEPTPLVLNAFRHQRFDTLTAQSSHRFSCCAQRLSASEIRHSNHTCNSCCVSRVLNAFRHQRFDTSEATVIACDVSRAQRLSASEIRHAIRYSKGLSQYRAQRLSASEIRHLSNYMRMRMKVRVLNAFRHQRFDTPRCN